MRLSRSSRCDIIRARETSHHSESPSPHSREAASSENCGTVCGTRNLEQIILQLAPSVARDLPTWPRTEGDAACTTTVESSGNEISVSASVQSEQRVPDTSRSAIQ